MAAIVDISAKGKHRCFRRWNTSGCVNASVVDSLRRLQGIWTSPRDGDGHDGRCVGLA